MKRSQRAPHLVAEIVAPGKFSAETCHMRLLSDLAGNFDVLQLHLNLTSSFSLQCAATTTYKVFVRAA